MKRDWKVSPNNWTGTCEAFSAGFDKDATRKSRVLLRGSVKACKSLSFFLKENLHIMPHLNEE